jgi:hypothetical protein
MNLVLQDDLEILTGKMFMGHLAHEISPCLRNLDSVGLLHSTFWCLIIHCSTLILARKFNISAAPCSSTFLIIDSIIAKDDQVLNTSREEVIVYRNSRSED